MSDQFFLEGYRITCGNTEAVLYPIDGETFEVRVNNRVLSSGGDFHASRISILEALRDIDPEYKEMASSISRWATFQVDPFDPAEKK